MPRLSTTTFWIALVIVAGAVFAAAQSTVRPGDPTQARVWIENRAPNEAVPVSIERFGATPSVHISSVDASVVLPSRTARQPWEYRVVAFENGALVAAGNEGWEAVGVVMSSGSANVLMKRPR